MVHYAPAWILLFGCIVTSAALAVLRMIFQQNWKRLAFLLACFLGYCILIPILWALTGPSGMWFAPFLEEPLKLAVITALAIKGRSPVAICLAFAGIEIASKAGLVVGPLTPLLFLQWMMVLASPAMMHCATGFLYAARNEGDRGPMLVAAIVLHFTHNQVVIETFSPTTPGANAVFLLMLGAGELLLAFAVATWFEDRAGRHVGPVKADPQ